MTGALMLSEENLLPLDHQEMIIAVAAGRPIEEAAEIGGMTGRNLRNLLKLPLYRQAVKKVCDDAWEENLRKIYTHFDEVKDTFLSIMRDSENDFAKLNAAVNMRTLIFSGRELQTQQEIDELKDQLAELKNTIESR